MNETTVRTAMAFSGFCLVSWGISLLSIPIMLIFCGLVAVGLAWMSVPRNE